MSDELIWVRHPDLPDSAKQVRMRKLRSLAGSGWVRLSDDEVDDLLDEQENERAERRRRRERPADEPVDTTEHDVEGAPSDIDEES